MTTPFVSAPQTTQQVLWTSAINVGNGGLDSLGTVSATDRFQVEANRATIGNVPTSYRFDCVPVSGSGLAADHLQITGVYDPSLTSSTNVEHADIYAVTSTGSAGTAAVSCYRTNNSLPLNWAAPWIGNFTGTGAPQVISVAGIPASSAVRFALVGSVGTGLATACPAPASTSIQPNVSFTTTATLSAIYAYEVLVA
jgi:hypothetical protein